MSKLLPEVTALTQPYWDAAAQGYLAIQRCSACGYWIHFPEPQCPRCRDNDLRFSAVSGVGVIESFTIIYRSFVAGYADNPYVVAWVELPEQPGLRVLANIIDCELDALFIGQRVKVGFEQRDSFGAIPVFRPA